MWWGWVMEKSELTEGDSLTDGQVCCSHISCFSCSHCSDHWGSLRPAAVNDWWRHKSYQESSSPWMTSQPRSSCVRAEWRYRRRDSLSSSVRLCFCVRTRFNWSHRSAEWRPESTVFPVRHGVLWAFVSLKASRYNLFLEMCSLQWWKLNCCWFLHFLSDSSTETSTPLTLNPEPAAGSLSLAQRSDTEGHKFCLHTPLKLNNQHVISFFKKIIQTVKIKC